MIANLDIRRALDSSLLFTTLILLGISLTSCHSTAGSLNKHSSKLFDPSSCDVSAELKKEIASHENVVKQIADLVLHGTEKHSTYDELALFVDTFGPRLSGSQSLANAIAFMLEKFNSSKLNNVHGEPAMIPKWERGNEWALVIAPVNHSMQIMALGKSVGTNGKVVEGEVVEVRNWNELDQLGKNGLLRDKIVMYNFKFTNYPETVAFRSRGASRAAPYGAIAALVRSVTPFSIYSPHTGATDYSQGVTKIPTAAITLEDADFIDRWLQRNKKVVVQVYMEAQNFADVESHNVVGDITGSEKSEQVVLVSGHIDSWDVTQGALDDGGGMIISYKALDVLRKLKLVAKRTVRAVLWTSEEFGYWGAKQYFANRQADKSLSKFQAVFESDLGTFTPTGLSIAPNAKTETKCIVYEVMQLLKPYNMSSFDTNFEGSDIELFSEVGVPSLSLANKNDKYFYYHHTRGDSMSIENPDDLDMATFLWAATSYVLANISVDLAR